MYSRIDEAVGNSNGNVWVALGNFCVTFIPRWEIRKVNWERLTVWRGVCGIGGMTRYE